MKIANKKSYVQFLLIGIVPVVLMWGIVWVICLSLPSIEIVNKDQSIPFGVYTDQELNGNSTASAEKKQSQGIIFTYLLKEGFAYPYTGISFAPETGVLALKENSFFSVELIVETAAVIPFIITENIKDKTGKTVMRIAQYELKTTPGTQTYTIPLEKFAVPSWWYKSNQLAESDFPTFDFSSTKSICIQNSALAVANKKERIFVKQITNVPDISSWIWMAGIFSICWITGYGIHIAFKKKKETPVFIPYVATTTDEKIADEWTQIRTYISANYMNDIDMEGMGKELGIAKHKIALLIKEHTTLIFKQYLNQIKVAEAKRLLLETNLPIGEIADQVGFGHLSNFNRVFKQYAGVSPSDFRNSQILK